MLSIQVDEYTDGLAFNIKGHEVAFYSNITERVRYNEYGLKIVYEEYSTIGCLEIPVEENVFIIKEIEKYKNKDARKEKNGRKHQS